MRVSLQEHFEAILIERDLRFREAVESIKASAAAERLASEKAVNAALLAAEKAINAALSAVERSGAKAEAATEKRLEGMNEFRQTLSDQQKTFVTRQELEALSERVAANSSSISSSSGRGAGLNAGWIYLVGFGTLLAAVAGIAGLVIAIIRVSP